MMSNEIFVERELQVRCGAASSVITLRVYAPRLVGPENYRCTFEIILGSKVVKKGELVGVDGLQALVLSLGMVLVHLERLVLSLDGKIIPEEWMDLRRFRFKRTESSTKPLAERMRSRRRPSWRKLAER